MKFPRTDAIHTIQAFLADSTKSILLLDGPRFAGKSTLLQHVYASTEIWTGKKYYYSFANTLGGQQFRDAAEFVQYMQIKHGLDMTKPGLLFLDEIQYSKSIGTILHDLFQQMLTHSPQGAASPIRIKILATGISHGGYQEFLGLHPSEYSVLPIYTISYIEYLEYKGFHMDYFAPGKFSAILAQEMRPLLQEFLNRGAYPQVLLAPTQEKKQEALTHIMQEIYQMDVSFWFDRFDVGYFQPILTIINDQRGQVYNKHQIKTQHNIPLRVVDAYLTFLEDNYLIASIEHRHTDKKREVSLKKKAMLLDMGIKNHLHGHFSRKLYDYRTMLYMVIQELYKTLPHDAKIYTYKKINGSEIDIIVEYNDLAYPIVIGERDSDAMPKVFEGFLKAYGGRIGGLLKTTPGSASVREICGEHCVQFQTVPYFLIGLRAKTIST
jgi:predicted AAA+ superfamily ATPase